jgi:hypothetical protein
MTTIPPARWKICLALLPLSVARADVPPRATELAPVPRADLCVTEGALEDVRDGRLAVSTPKMRAYLNKPSTDAAELSFTYLGPTTTESRLGSGASRHQFGLKLRAQDACNLVYLMWRIEPESKLVGSVKSNPGQRSSAQCTNHGYRNIKPTLSAAIPPLASGQTHLLRAQIENEELRAFIDGRIVWRGSLDASAAPLKGPVGIRSDNAHLEFVMSAQSLRVPASDLIARCRSGPDEAE